MCQGLNCEQELIAHDSSPALPDGMQILKKKGAMSRTKGKVSRTKGKVSRLDL
jgi:hypothetical protein